MLRPALRSSAFVPSTATPCAWRTLRRPSRWTSCARCRLCSLARGCCPRGGPGRVPRKRCVGGASGGLWGGGLAALTGLAVAVDLDVVTDGAEVGLPREVAQLPLDVARDHGGDLAARRADQVVVVLG